MRVLLDHNLPHKLRTNLGTPGKHEFVTASYMRWGDLKNGELLRAAEERGKGKVPSSTARGGGVKSFV